jgi:hypothetical protein
MSKCCLVIVEIGEEDATGETVLKWWEKGVAVLPLPTLLSHESLKVSHQFKRIWN